ncbi:DUF4890 domain-containing protein [Telluribacter humicola]|uniref:DUF4890 domain-containing protein n=1 Tax=Telluribacter humicola TaxID=1720261 RepID=UPI001A9635A5|nr:DUF4890 domain-containing protein [Telluribacter humicola]
MKTVMLAMMLALSSMTVFAQRGGDRPTPEQRAENQTKFMTEKLELSDKQQKQVYALNISRMQKMQDLRKNEDREGMKAAHESYQKELSAILTPAQQDKYKTLRQEMRQRGNVQRGRNYHGQKKDHPKHQSGQQGEKALKSKDARK